MKEGGLDLPGRILSPYSYTGPSTYLAEIMSGHLLITSYGSQMTAGPSQVFFCHNFYDAVRYDRRNRWTSTCEVDVEPVRALANSQYSMLGVPKVILIYS